MPSTADLLFELERRVILFRPITTLEDGVSQLGYDDDPNLISSDPSSRTDGENLLYASPVGTRYQESDGTQWYKRTMPNTWEEFGAGALGPTGPTGPTGPAGPNEIGGYPIEVESGFNSTDNDLNLLQFVNGVWTNIPQEKVTDGGDF